MDTTMSRTETVLSEIKKDHDKARDLFAKIDQAESVNWDDVKELYISLKGHHYAEEEVVFPAVKPFNYQTEELVEKLIDEHEQADETIMDMIDDQDFNQSDFMMIMEIVERHMQKEEGELFRIAREHLGKEQLEAAYEPFKKAEEKGKEEARAELQ